MVAKLKFSLAAPAKRPRNRVLIFTTLLALLAPWTSVAFSQDGESIPPFAYQNAMKQWGRDFPRNSDNVDCGI
jgi:hypothetical protein